MGWRLELMLRSLRIPRQRSSLRLWSSAVSSICRLSLVLVFVFVSEPVAIGQESALRLFPTAPTSYRRPAQPWNSSTTPQRIVRPDTTEADIPQSHLLYSLHAPPQGSEIRSSRPLLPGHGILQAGAQQIQPESEVVHTGGIDSPLQQKIELLQGCRSASPFQGEFRPTDDSLIEHIQAPSEWTRELSLETDLARAWGRLRDDTYGLLHPNNVLLLGLAGGGAIGLRQNADERVRSYTMDHPDRWGVATDILGELGYINVQLPVLLGSYFWSLHTQDHDLHDFNSTMLSAFTINGVSTVIIKAAANTDRPSATFNGGKFGFPSYHASSSFTIASVLDEYYGHRVGIPAYAVAGMIAWSRIDSRDHDLSDVLFGSALGFVIGKSVARHHLIGDSRVQLLPWIEPIGGTSGLQLSMVW